MENALQSSHIRKHWRSSMINRIALARGAEEPQAWPAKAAYLVDSEYVRYRTLPYSRVRFDALTISGPAPLSLDIDHVIEWKVRYMSSHMTMTFHATTTPIQQRSLCYKELSSHL